MTGFKGKFSIHKWKFYLVDMQDFQNPVVVRKHFFTKQQAIDFKLRYCNKWYETVLGKDALNMELSDWFNYKPKHRHAVAKFTKYLFPPHVKTQRQKQIFRHNQRKKLIKKKRRPMINYKMLKELLDNKEVLFFKRLRNFTSYYDAYSNKVIPFKDFRKEYDYPEDIVHLSAIWKCLTRHYDLGLYNYAEVAMYIYALFPEKVKKWRGGPDMTHKNEEDVKREYLARGFVDKRHSGFTKEDAFVETIFIKPTLVYPEQCWFTGDDMVMYDHRVYDLQPMVGIQGYCRAHTGEI